MIKAALIAAIIKHLEETRDKALIAAEAARATAVDKENIAENKYDTLGLEAAYLAHGQSSRVQEIVLELAEFYKLATLKAAGPIAVSLGSLVHLTDDKNNSRWLLVGPGAAGLTINHGNITVTVITSDSPLGKSIIGATIDDEVSFAVADQLNWFSIVEIV